MSIESKPSRGSPKWLLEKTKREKSQSQERSLAKDLKGEVVKGSGSQDTYKGDVKTPHFLIEAKYTEKQSYSLHRQTIEKIRGEANDQNKEWAMAIDIDGLKVAVIPYQLFLEVAE